MCTRSPFRLVFVVAGACGMSEPPRVMDATVAARDGAPGGDAESRRDAAAPLDASEAADATVPRTDAPTGTCVRARLLWSDGFESGDYQNWTSRTYNAEWGNDCQSNAITTERVRSGTRAQRSEITCAHSESHRGYGGLQFSGDSVVPAYTNTGTGIDAPFGVVNTYWSFLEVPYAFENGRWFSFWTINTDCGWRENVITLGLENTSNRLTPAHIVNNGGTVEFEPGAPGFPLGEWVRTTIYVNLHDGVMHVWQNGTSLLHATVTRPTNDICQWHWGAYASPDNTDVVLIEDDNAIWRLEEAWTDWSREPWLDGGVAACTTP